MNASEMKAGAKMDARIHREVFGGEVVWSGTEGDGDAVPFIGPWREEPHWDQIRHPGEMRKCSDMVPAYSTDIAAAWTAVEKMSELGWSCTVEVAPGEPACAMFFRGRTNDGATDAHSAQGATVPEAICRAALAALGATP